MPPVQMTDTAAERRDAEFRAFKKGSASDVADIAARIIVVVLMALTLIYATGQFLFLICAAVYAAAILLFVVFLNSVPDPVRAIHLRISLAAYIFITGLFCGMTIYVATLANGAYVMVAACGCVGLALHCLARNSEFSSPAFVDFFATMITGSIVVVIAGVAAPSVGVTIAIIIGGLCVEGYFCLSFRQIITERQTLTRKLRAESQNQKMLALGQLTSGVAHDFNNLLTVINGNLELARLDPNNPENATFLREAETAGHRGAELVRQLLAYARKSQITLSNVNLAALFARAEAVLARTLPVHVRLQLDRIDPDKTVRGDASLLESAMLNLVINARDAIGNAPGEIRIAVQDDPEIDCLRIIVTDSGPGMTPDLLQRASEPFFTTKAVGDGSGLGLSMVKGFAEQSGGRMELENAPGAGLRVSLCLPRGEQVDPARG